MRSVATTNAMNITNAPSQWPHAADQIVATSPNHGGRKAGRILNPSPIKGRPTTLFLRTPFLSLLRPHLPPPAPIYSALLYSTHSPNCQPNPPSLSSSVYRARPSSSAIPQAHQLLPEADAVGAIQCPPASPCHGTETEGVSGLWAPLLSETRRRHRHLL